MASEPEIYVLRTKLSPAQVAEALESSMDDSQLDFIFRVNASGHRPIIGNAERDHCRLMRRPEFLSSDYAGIFDASIFEENGCTRLDGQFVKVEFGWLGGSRNSRIASINSIKIGIIIVVLFEAYNAFGAFTDAEHPLLNPPSVFAGLLLVMQCLWLPVAIRIRRKQREFILGHVKKVLNATQVD